MYVEEYKRTKKSEPELHDEDDNGICNMHCIMSYNQTIVHTLLDLILKRERKNYFCKDSKKIRTGLTNECLKLIENSCMHTCTPVFLCCA
jgi:hypothetical protein